MPQKIILDGDPGIDDAMAIFFALRHPELEVVGLTTGFDNTYVENCTSNALKVVETAGRTDVPVIQGAGRPMINPLRPRAGRFHSEDGLGNVGDQFPDPTTKPLEISGAQFIVDTVMANPGEITLVPVGRMTNLALVLLLEPAFVENVKEVVVIGGAADVPGNATPVAEASIFEESHAAQIVFSAAWPFTMVGLDVTMKVPMPPAYIDELGAIGNPETDFISKIVPYYQWAYAGFHNSGGTIYCLDASAVACVIDPTLFEIERVPIYIGTEGKATGFTIPDRSGYFEETVEIDVCTGVDHERLLKLYMETMS